MNFWIGLSAAFVCCLALIVPADTRGANAPTLSPDVRRDATVEAVSLVTPSIVNIATEGEINDPEQSMRRRFFGPYYQPRTSHSLGSGVIIDEEGYILTNLHVVRGASRIMVRLADGRERTAEPVADQGWSDVALLKIVREPEDKDKPFKAIRLAREDDLLLGETVLALGNPFGLGGSVSRGILSSKNRRPFRQSESLEYSDWLQTDAAINPGNSGGPLVNLRGELIGINVAVFREGQGIGFAIPIKHVYEALTSFFTPESVSKLWFGARVQFTTLEVASVEEGSPAARGGLAKGDVVQKINGRRVQNLIDLNREMVHSGTRQALALEVLRKGSPATATVRLTAETTLFNQDLIQKRTGLAVRALRPQEAKELGVGGLLIRGVETNSPAASLRLEPDVFILTHLDGTPVSDITSAAKLLHQKKTGAIVRMGVVFFTESRLGTRMMTAEQALKVR